MEKELRIIRVLAYMKAAGLTPERDHFRLNMGNRQLQFENDKVNIIRPGFPVRSMAYSRLNLDRLISLAVH